MEFRPTSPRKAFALPVLVTLGVMTALASCAPPNEATDYPGAEPDEGEAAVRSEAPQQEEPDRPRLGLATYFDREVDLEPFLAGFPYGSFEPRLETGKFFYYEKGETYTLRMLDVPPAGQRFDLAAGKAISDVDWSKRSLWDMHHHVASDTLWLHADASNDEQMNLWTLSLADGKLEQVTQHDYVYGVGFSEDDKTIAYLPRKGKKAPFSTCLHLREVDSGTERVVVCDTPELTFTWGSPTFSPDGKELFFDAQVEGDRTRVQLVRVDLTAAKPTVEVLTDPKVSRNSPSIIDGWLDERRLLFRANDDGFANLYSYDRKTKKIEQLTRYKEDLSSAKLDGDDVVAVHGTPAGATLVRLDARTGKERAAEKMPGTVYVTDAHHGRVLVTQVSPDKVHETASIELRKPGLDRETVIALDPDLESQIVACEASAVKIPTFDGRELHAFLLEPRRPLSDDGQRLALIRSFYGGSNRYSQIDNILCAAGLTVVSPAVRGSSGFGKEFFSLNDKDLGGDEIVDLFWVARWLEKRSGLTDRRIGVFGGSHGGYATMRALTFPPETNGRNDLYAFGFGMSHAGFSDIKSFYDATNIPDWVVLESGDPNRPEDLAKMNDRSPLTHALRLRAPLLVTHGSQDWRVPVDESRQFVKATQSQGLPVQYVEFEGQGHHIEGLSLQVELYQARFDFLRAVAEAATQSETAG